MLIPFFLAPLTVISTEQNIKLANEQKYNLTSNITTGTNYFNELPENPVIYHDTNIYEDRNLTVPSKTIKADTELSIASIFINDNTIPVFELSDGSYIEASRQLIYDDIVYSKEDISSTYWLMNSFKVYENPYVFGVKEAKTDLCAYNKVTVTQKAVTGHGTYYKVDGKGWISKDFLSDTDNRMEEVQTMLTQKYNKSNYSIYVKQLSSQNMASINANTIMYSASVAKLATLYYTEEQIQNGTILADTKFKYIDAVNSFDKSYDPSGTGNISKTADNEDYSVDTLLKAIAQNSDNVATNILGYYVANQYDDRFNSEISAIAGTNIDMKGRNMSAETAGNLMEAIYKQNGSIINYLSTTDFDSSRISRDISVRVAHKIGDAYDYKHDVAIVYAGEPFILSVFTNNASHDDISNIANDVYAILK